MESLVIRWSHKSTGQFFRTQDFVSPALWGNAPTFSKTCRKSNDDFGRTPVSGHDSFPETHETGVKYKSITVRIWFYKLKNIKVEETWRFDSRNHRSVACWLPQAVIVHELSHAYHSISYRDGVTNKKIKEAYEKGVAAGYYDTRRKNAQEDDEEIGGWI